MAVQLTVDAKRKLFVATYTGEIHDEEILGLAALVRSHPEFDESFSITWDFSGVTGGSISTSAMQELSRRESILSPTSMHVIVAPQDHIFGIFRMGQVLAEKTKPKVVVVRSTDQANRLLAL